MANSQDDRWYESRHTRPDRDEGRYGGGRDEDRRREGSAASSGRARYGRPESDADHLYYEERAYGRSGPGEERGRDRGGYGASQGGGGYGQRGDDRRSRHGRRSSGHHDHDDLPFERTDEGGRYGEVTHMQGGYYDGRREAHAAGRGERDFRQGSEYLRHQSQEAWRSDLRDQRAARHGTQHMEGQRGSVDTGFGGGAFGAQAGHARGKGPKGYTRSDERIREEICDCLTDDEHLDASNIEIAVLKGEVTLSGTVDSRHAKRHAEDLAEEISGVRHVQNNIRVEAESGKQGTATSIGT